MSIILLFWNAPAVYGILRAPAGPDPLAPCAFRTGASVRTGAYARRQSWIGRRLAWTGQASGRHRAPGTQKTFDRGRPWQYLLLLPHSGPFAGSRIILCLISAPCQQGAFSVWTGGLPDRSKRPGTRRFSLGSRPLRAPESAPLTAPVLHHIAAAWATSRPDCARLAQKPAFPVPGSLHPQYDWIPCKHLHTTRVSALP